MSIGVRRPSVSRLWLYAMGFVALALVVRAVGPTSPEPPRGFVLIEGDAVARALKGAQIPRLERKSERLLLEMIEFRLSALDRRLTHLAAGSSGLPGGLVDGDMLRVDAQRGESHGLPSSTYFSTSLRLESPAAALESPAAAHDLRPRWEAVVRPTSAFARHALAVRDADGRLWIARADDEIGIGHGEEPSPRLLELIAETALGPPPDALLSWWSAEQYRLEFGQPPAGPNVWEDSARIESLWRDAVAAVLARRRVELARALPPIELLDDGCLVYRTPRGSGWSPITFHPDPHVLSASTPGLRLILARFGVDLLSDGVQLRLVLLHEAAHVDDFARFVTLPEWHGGEDVERSHVAHALLEAHADHVAHELARECGLGDAWTRLRRRMRRGASAHLSQRDGQRTSPTTSEDLRELGLRAIRARHAVDGERGVERLMRSPPTTVEALRSIE